MPGPVVDAAPGRRPCRWRGSPPRRRAGSARASSRGQRGFAQHVVGVAEALAPRSARALRQRLGDGLAGDELLAHHAHRQVDALADQRLAALADQARRARRDRPVSLCVRDQLAGEQQAPGGGVDEQRRAAAQVRLPVAAARSCRGSARRAWPRRGCAAALRPGTSAPRLPATTARIPAAAPAPARRGRRRSCARAAPARAGAPAHARRRRSAAAGAPRRAAAARPRARAAVGGGDRGAQRRARGARRPPGSGVIGALGVRGPGSPPPGLPARCRPT